MNLKLKYSLIVLLSLSLLISLSVVSAEDNLMDDANFSEDIEGDNNLDYALNENCESAIDDQSSLYEDISSLSVADGKSFDDIQSAIDDSHDQDIIGLDGIYTSSGKPIKVNRTLTIMGNGEGATLDGNSISRIFDLEADNITLQNLKIINSNFTANGPNQGSVYCIGENISIINCTFIHNICQDMESYGGAIRWKGNNGKLNNSIFINNSAYRGGAIQLVGSNYIVNNSEFIDNFAFFQEGAVFLAPNSNDSIIENCIFRNNSASGLCGALRACSDNNKILNSQFIDNHAGTEAGAILICNAGNYIENCIFLNNSATDGGAIFFKRTNNVVSKCTFINNSANNGAAIYNNQSDAENAVRHSIFDNNEVAEKASAYYGDGSNLIGNFYGKNFYSNAEFIASNLIFNGTDFNSPSSWVNIKGEKIVYQNLNQAVPSILKFILNDGTDLTEALPEYNVCLSNKMSQNMIFPDYISFKANLGQFNYLPLDFVEDAVMVLNINDGSSILDIPVNFTNVPISIPTKLIFRNMTTKSVDVKIDGKVGQYFSFTLMDINGNALANRNVQVKLNGIVYNLKTNAKGLAKLQINLKKVKTYYASISFAGGNGYGKVSASAKIIVKKQNFKLHVPKKSFRSKRKIKRLTATLKSSKGKAVKGKRLVFTINKKRYIAKTNSKGIATVKVKLNRKKTYKFKVRYAGDGNVNSIAKFSKLKIY